MANPQVPTYGHKTAATQGFLPVSNSVHNKNNSCLVITTDPNEKLFEPSPVFAAAGFKAGISGFVNIVLHLVCVILTIVAAVIYYPNTDDDKYENLTKNHSHDFVGSWIWIMLIFQIFNTLLTVFYYGFFFNAFLVPIVGHIGLGLQMCSTLCATKLSYWIATDASASSIRDHDGDWVIVLTMYAGIFLIAGYVMTPLSGVYYKLMMDSHSMSR